MRGLVLLFLVGCAGGDGGPKDSGDEPLPELGEVYVSLYANAEPGTFRSDCLIELDLFQEGVDDAVASVDLYTIGGAWSGHTLPTTDLYTALATWQNCTTGPEGWGESEAPNFSGGPGDWFIFHYNGVLGAYGNGTQREDFDGGVVEVTFQEDSTDDEVRELAAELGLEVEGISGRTYYLRWMEARSVGSVLTELSAERIYYRGGPVWSRTPDWY